MENLIREWLTVEHPFIKRSCIKHIQGWLDSTTNSIKNCYKKPSKRFLNIEDDVHKDMRTVNGGMYRIIAYNRFYFICAYVYPIGYRRRLRVISKYPLEDCYITDYTLPGLYIREAQ